MSLEKTIQELKELLNRCVHDLQKTEKGNKAAAQRVRTGTVKLEKVAKRFRKESVKEEKTGGFKKYKTSAKKGKKAAPAKKGKKAASAKKAAPKKAVSKKQAAPKKKASKTTASKKKVAVKRPANKSRQTRFGW